MSSGSSLGLYSQETTAAWTTLAILVREDIAYSTSFLPSAISCMGLRRFCYLVPVADSIAWYCNDS